MAFFVTPVTILTGFLGSGKTTLLNRFLKEAHGKRFVVIENEFGEVSVDDILVYEEAVETVVQLVNGCICCKVRGDLARALGDLAQRRIKGEIEFDHVLIETSGLADPGPVIQTFLAETALLAHYVLDGVVTLADGVNIGRSLNNADEATAQLALADRVFITKEDLLNKEQLQNAKLLVRRINETTSISVVDLVSAGWDEVFRTLLEIRGYEFDRVSFENISAAQVTSDHHDNASHTCDVSTVGFRTSNALDPGMIQKAFAVIKEDMGDRIWRMKGVLSIDKHPKRVVVQGVGELLQVNEGRIWRPFEPRETHFIVIGKSLNEKLILDVLKQAECLPVPPQNLSR